MRRVLAIIAVLAVIGSWLAGCAANPPGNGTAPGGPGVSAAGRPTPSATATHSPKAGDSGVPSAAPSGVGGSSSPPPSGLVTPGPNASAAGEIPTTVRFQGTIWYEEQLDRVGGADITDPTEHHDIRGVLGLLLKFDPSQSDSERLVWVDDGGGWQFDGTGSSRLSDGCTDLGDTFHGLGTFATWDPNIEGTGMVQLTIFADRQAQPRAQLGFSLTGHETRSGNVRSGPDCKPFHAESTWPFPTSMAGGLLDGAVLTDAGTVGVYLGTPGPVVQGDWTDFWYGSLLEVR